MKRIQKMTFLGCDLYIDTDDESVLRRVEDCLWEITQDHNISHSPDYTKMKADGAFN